MKALYHRFTTTPAHIKALEQEREQLHRQLSAQLDKPARAILLRLMDQDEEILFQACLHSFISGYRLAYGIQQELLASEQKCFDDESEFCEHPNH